MVNHNKLGGFLAPLLAICTVLLAICTVFTVESHGSAWDLDHEKES